MGVLTLVPLDDPQWIGLAQSASGATPFHHPAWALMLSECYGYPAFGLGMTRGESLVGGIPMMEVKRPLGRKRWVSLPFTDAAPPLVIDPADGGALVAACVETMRLAGIEGLEVHAPVEGSGVDRRTVGVVHTLALDPDPEVIRRYLGKSQVLRNIARAEREPIVVRRAATRDQLTRDYYDLHLRSRRRQGVPVQPRRFFELLWDRVLATGLGFLLLAYADDRPVAGAVFLAWNRTVTYKYGASDPQYLRLRPNHLIFWDAIRWACEEGFQVFDFGRTEHENDGLRRFKAGWSSDEEKLVYSAIGVAGRDLGSSPLRDIVSGAIRHSPLWVTRALGEAFYRFVP